MGTVLAYDKSKEALDLRELSASCLNSLERELQLQGVVIEKTFAVSASYTSADASVAKTLLSAILCESASAMPRGGSLHVTVGSTDREVFVSIRDSGWGIPLEAVPLVFGEQFGRARWFPISQLRFHQLLESQHGTINVDRRPGQGSTVTIFFPALERVSSPAALRFLPAV